MFEQSLILRAGLDKGIDVGLLAETLFFYGSTHILLDSRSVLALARIIPSGDLIALLDRNAIKISYLRQQFVVLTGGMPAVHDFGAVTLHRTGLGKPRLDYREEIQFALERGFGSTRQTKKLARAIADRVKLHRFSDNENREKSITDSARSDVRDSDFVKRAVAATLRHLVPEYNILEHFQFELFDTGRGFSAITDLDFAAINAVYHQTVPVGHSSISAAYVLGHILEARADTFFAAYYMAEPVTGPVYSDIIKLKHFDFLRRTCIERRGC